VDNFQEVAAVSRKLGSVLTHKFCGRGFLLRRKPKSLLLVDSDYMLIFEDGVMTASRRTKNFEGFEKYFLIPSDIMIFKEEGNVKLPATMANRCFHIFSCIKKSQSSEDIGKFHIFLAWFR
jgi:hypothetical protein